MRPNIKQFRLSVLQCYIERHLPFDSIDDKSFKRAILASNQGMKDYLFGRDTMKDRAKDEYTVAREKLKLILQEALSKIHISFDIWASPFSTDVFLGVVTHFVLEKDSKTVTQSILLALRRLNGTHSGENIAELLSDVLIEFEIVDKVDVFIADNVESNDVAIEELLQLKAASPDVTKRCQEDSLYPLL